jgi:feruloyl esterase
MNLPLSETTVTAAQVVPAGTFTPPGSTTPITNLPEFRRVALTVAPAIHLEVWMPTTTWNQRYRGEGGGYARSISYGGLGTGIRAGLELAGAPNYG